jgi:hypothetical protein
MFCVLWSLALLPAGPAHGQEQRPAHPTTAREHAAGSDGEWYGLQTVAVDGIALILIGSGVAVQNAPVAILGLGAFILGAPIVHWAHGNSWGAASLGIRVAALALLFGAALTEFHGCFTLYEDSGDPEPAGCASARTQSGILTALGLLGGLGAIVLDAVQARDESPQPTAAFNLWTDPRSRSVGVVFRVPVL